MKKKVFAGLSTGFLVLGMVGMANAAPFTDMIDFDEEVAAGVTYTEIWDDYSYSHTLPGLTTPDFALLDATLSLRHVNNSANASNNNSGEIWFSSIENDVDIILGQLSDSSGTVWVTDTWTLSADVLALMTSVNPWQLTVRIYDTTVGHDNLRLDWSSLTGTYEETAPVPEPATMLLFGTGIAGFAGSRFRRKKKA